MRCPIRAGKVRRICAACSSSSRGGYHSTVYWIGKGLRTASGSAEVSFHRSSKSRCLLGSKEGMSWQCSPASEDAHLVTSLDLMEETGYLTTSREISGLDPDTENRGQPMLSIAIKKTFAMIVLATATITAEAASSRQVRRPITLSAATSSDSTQSLASRGFICPIKVESMSSRVKIAEETRRAMYLRSGISRKYHNWYWSSSRRICSPGSFVHSAVMCACEPRSKSSASRAIGWRLSFQQRSARIFR